MYYICGNKKFVEMKLEDLTVKTVLALFIVMFGMISVVLIVMNDTTENSLINLIIMVVSYHFGSSSGNTAKDKANSEALAEIERLRKEKEKNSNTSKENEAIPPIEPGDIGGGGIRNPTNP